MIFEAYLIIFAEPFLTNPMAKRPTRLKKSLIVYRFSVSTQKNKK